MLGEVPVTTMLPVVDMARAREFYEKKLGFKPKGASPEGKQLYDCGGATIALYRGRRRPPPTTRL